VLPILLSMWTDTVTVWREIGTFINSPYVGWVGIAAAPVGVATIVHALTRKCPTSTTHTPEGDK
jgi:hypothetical protein